MTSAAQALADVATIAILQHRAALKAQVLNEQLSMALNSGVVIEQALLLLRGHFRSQNLRLADVAESVIDRTLLAIVEPSSEPRPRR